MYRCVMVMNVIWNATEDIAGRRAKMVNVVCYATVTSASKRNVTKKTANGHAINLLKRQQVSRSTLPMVSDQTRLLLFQQSLLRRGERES